MWEQPPFAISGYCAEGIGVAGYSEKGTAVHGNGVWNPDMGGTVNCVGVGGHSNYGIGVQASSPNGIALKVEGKSDFNGKIGDPLIIGQDHWAEEGKKTELNGNVDSWTLNITNGGQGGAICGGTLGGIAIAGYANNGISIHGNSSNGIGVNGCSDHSTGVLAESSNGIALEVKGKSNFNGRGYLSAKVNDIPNGTGMSAALLVENLAGAIEGNVPPQAIAGMALQGRGVEGQSVSGEGVIGIAQETGTGVRGEAWTNGIGVYAASKSGTALKVEGKSSFSTVGSGKIPRLRKSFTVSVASGLMTEKSHISVTLTSDPMVLGGDAAISWIQRDPANSRFTINLTKAVGKDTTFTYFIVEP